jgi:hypothetical protein
MIVTLNKQVGYTEWLIEEIEETFEEDSSKVYFHKDDIITLKAILQSLNNYRALLGNKNLQK